MKTKKPCSLCPQLAQERDQLLSYQELYQKTKEQKAELQKALQRAWKLTELKNWPSQRLLEELISRKLVMVQQDSHTRKIQGYYLWRVDLEKYDQAQKAHD